MKAFLLCAGKGTRLGEITKETPKCLLKVGTKTMLEHWYYWFDKHHVTEVLINTHHLADKVIAGYSKICKQFPNIKTTFVYEKELVGTAKTIFNNRSFIQGERYFFIAYSDTWMQVDMNEMYRFQKKRGGIGTIGVHKPTILTDQGVFTIKDRKIVDFEEKPKNPKGQHAFSGIMVGSQGMFKFYEESMNDLARDWFPKFVQGMNPYFIDGHVLDIGTPDRYREACCIVHGLGLKAL